MNKEIKYGKLDIAFFCAAILFLYFHLFQFPATPIHIEGDQLLVTTNAIRLMNGETMYRDFFHLASPGSEVYYAGMFSVFGVKIWIFNFTVFLVGLALTWQTWFFSRQILSGLLVYLPSALLLTIGFRYALLDAGYRLNSIVFLLFAVAVLMKARSTRNLVIAGSLCGLSTFFLQTRGVVGIVGIGIFLLVESLSEQGWFSKFVRRSLALCIPFVAVAALTQFYFVYQAGFDNYYFSTVTFLKENYPADPLNQPGAFFWDLPQIDYLLEKHSPLVAMSHAFRQLIPVFLAIAIAITYLAVAFTFLFRYRKRLREFAPHLLLFCVGSILMLGVSSFTTLRVLQIAGPGLVLMVWLVLEFGAPRKILGGGLLALAVAAAGYTVQRQIVSKFDVATPSGKIHILSPDSFQRHAWIAANTKPGDTFFEAFHPNFYYPFQLVNPTPMYLLRDSEYTPQFQVDSVVRSLEKTRPQYIFWPQKWSKNDDARRADDHLAELWKFIQANYEIEVVFPSIGNYTGITEGSVGVWKLKVAEQH